jgi:hypothetical protein
LAQTFVANNWEIAPVLNQLLKANIFMIWLIEGFILNHLDLVIGSLCTFNLNYTVADPTTLKRNTGFGIIFSYYLVGLEQTMGRIPNVSGCCFYQNPPFMNIDQFKYHSKKILFLK